MSNSVLLLALMFLAAAAAAFAQKNASVLSTEALPVSADDTIFSVNGKFAIHGDGKVILSSGVTVEQAAEAFADFVSNKLKPFNPKGYNCIFAFNWIDRRSSGVNWTACLRPDGYVAYTGKALPRETIELLDLAAGKLAQK